VTRKALAEVLLHKMITLQSALMSTKCSSVTDVQNVQYTLHNTQLCDILMSSMYSYLSGNINIAVYLLTIQVKGQIFRYWLLTIFWLSSQ